jgi:hypothetical protein
VTGLKIRRKRNLKILTTTSKRNSNNSIPVHPYEKSPLSVAAREEKS